MFELKRIEQISLADRAALALILANYNIRNFTLKLFEKAFFSNKNIFSASNILIFRKGGMGDAIAALPAIQIIRSHFPSANIDLITARRLPAQAGLEEIAPPGMFSNIYTYKELLDRGLINKLKVQKYDLYIELPSNIASFSFELRTIWLAKLLGIRKGIGWQISSTKFMARRQEKLLSFYNDKDRLLKILKGYGFQINAGKYIFPVQEKEDAFVSSLLKTQSIFAKEKNIAMITGAGRPQNKWPVQYFKEVAAYYIGKGFNILLIGGAEEMGEAAKITGQNVFDFCGKLSTVQSAAMLKHCCISISNDTGPMHLSYSVGTPVVAVFSARDYAGKWFPPEEDNIVLRNTSVPCAICFSDTCMNNICMQAITPEMVIEKADYLLDIQADKPS